MYKNLNIYTDGSCLGNPGPGGWAYVVEGQNGEIIYKQNGHDPDTTNNRMEMTAVIEALKNRNSKRITIFTDSTYVKNGITSWINKWKKNGWKTRGGGLVKNIDLWKEISSLTANRIISWKWVKAHDGNILNEAADKLANKMAHNEVQDKSNSNDSISPLQRAVRRFKEKEAEDIITKGKKAMLTYIKSKNK